MDKLRCPACGSEIRILAGTCDSCETDLDVYAGLLKAKRILHRMAQDQVEEKRFLSAIGTIGQALKYDRRDTVLWTLGGLCHYAIGDIHPASLFWKQASTEQSEEYLRRTAGEVQAYQKIVGMYNHALVEAKKGHLRDAAAELRECLIQCPRFLKGHELYCLTLLALGDKERFRAAHQKATDVTHDSLLLEHLKPFVTTTTKSRTVTVAAMAAGIVAVLAFGSYHLFTIGSPDPSRTALGQQSVQPTSKPDDKALELLAEAGNHLYDSGSYLESAKVFQYISSQGIKPGYRAQLALKSAAIQHYQAGLKLFNRESYARAQGEFRQSLDCQSRTYVYDDALYLYALSLEKSGRVGESIRLYFRLLNEEASSNYVRASLIRLGRISAANRSIREKYSAMAEKYPQYLDIIFSFQKRWGEM